LAELDNFILARSSTVRHYFHFQLKAQRKQAGSACFLCAFNY